MKTHPFIIDGIVVLPEHIHMILTLPLDDANYSQRISWIKGTFSRQLEPTELIHSSKNNELVNDENLEDESTIKTSQKTFSVPNLIKNVS